MRRKKPDHAALIDALVKAWNDYPPNTRGTLMKEWPDLYFAVSHLVRTVEVQG